MGSGLRGRHRGRSDRLRPLHLRLGHRPLCPVALSLSRPVGHDVLDRRHFVCRDRPGRRLRCRRLPCRPDAFALAGGRGGRTGLPGRLSRLCRLGNRPGSDGGGARFRRRRCPEDRHRGDIRHGGRNGRRSRGGQWFGQWPILQRSVGRRVLVEPRRSGRRSSRSPCCSHPRCRCGAGRHIVRSRRRHAHLVGGTTRQCARAGRSRLSRASGRATHGLAASRGGAARRPGLRASPGGRQEGQGPRRPGAQEGRFGRLPDGRHHGARACRGLHRRGPRRHGPRQAHGALLAGRPALLVGAVQGTGNARSGGSLTTALHFNRRTPMYSALI
eukprot:Opistho-1_new@46124